MSNNVSQVVNPIIGEAVGHVKEATRLRYQVFKELRQIMPDNFKQQMGSAFYEFAGAAAIGMREFPSTSFNHVAGLGIEQPATEQETEHLISWLREHAGPVASVMLAHGAQPSELTEWLTQRGLQVVAGGLAYFWRDATPAKVPDSRFTLRQIGPENVPLFTHVICQSFGFPAHFANWLEPLAGREKWSVYVVLDGETPIATGSMFLHEDKAWLGCGATLESYRNQGAQSLLLAHRIEQARQAGSTGMAIETAHPGEGLPVNGSYRNILRAGFSLVCVLQQYLIP